MGHQDLAVAADGTSRCWWGASTDDYITYHDAEWGRPVTSEARLLEKLVLEGFQSGLSWLTILRKRENFRAAFASFDPAAVAAFGAHDVQRLLADTGIVRHRGKIEAAINNARATCALAERGEALPSLVWSYAPAEPEPDPRADWSYSVPGMTATSTRLARDLKRRGFVFVGPTTVYAFMQAMGLVNDHVAGCWVRDEVAVQQAAVRAKMAL